MKILIIGFTKLKYMPYMHFYLDKIDSVRNAISIFYWDRDDTEDSQLEESVALIPLHLQLSDETKKSNKILPFLKFRQYMLKFLKGNAFDRIIVLHSLPGVLIHGYLKKHYSGRYILDYRDSTYEYNSLFLRVIHSLVRHSFATFVSSEAFKKYMPANADNVHISHNILVDSLNHRNIGHYDEKLPIRISFWGLIRHLEINKIIIEKVARDPRFELHYYGREQETAFELKAYTKEINASNVFFHGEYLPQDRYEFARRASLIHNLYDNKDFNTINATANKYYDGIVFGIPQLCTHGSHMGNLVTSAGVGLAVEPMNSAAFEDIFNYFINLRRESFLLNCNAELDRVMSEYRIGAGVIDDFVS